MAFVVCYRGGVAIRVAPNIDAPCMGDVLDFKQVTVTVSAVSGELAAE